MTRIEESRCCGVNCGRGATTAILMMTSFYGVVCLGFSLVARLYLKMYYCTAHVAAMAVFAAVFVIVHHVGRVRWALGLPPVGFYVLQVVLNFCYCGSLLATAVGYSLLTTRDINDNYDHIAAAIVAFSGALVLGYILGLSIHIITSKRSRDRFEPDHFNFSESPRHSASEYDNHYNSNNQLHIPLETKSDLSGGGSMDFKSSKSSLTSTPPKYERTKSRCCPKFFLWMFRIFYWIFYILTHVLFLLFFVLTAYYPCSVIKDMEDYRWTSDMFTVRVPQHQPIALHMKCKGRGPETLVYENGLGGSVYATWSFIPQFLPKDIKVCVYDRRGYGWSETYESDSVRMLKDEPQWSKTNVPFFRALVDAANINRPFYLAGHSYGGHHLLYFALEYPELVKGLIFLDSSRFSAVDILESALEMVANFQPTGLMSVVLDFELFDYEKAFEEEIKLSEMSDDMKAASLAAMKSGSYALAYSRENTNIDKSRESVTNNLGNRQIDIPALVIDAGGESDWFPAGNFPRYNPDLDYIAVTGATHTSLTMSTFYGNITANHMIDFIRRIQKGRY